MPKLSTVPAPGPDCTPWQRVSPVGDGWYRRYDGNTRIQYLYPDGHTLEFDADW